mmetsp:Transcript_91730/g.137355  ORF Transcript_91730/g.137355 Transcript_91730/m.137355 type:complete len:248 (+) Transcript_91730:1488-2231(+)
MAAEVPIARDAAAGLALAMFSPMYPSNSMGFMPVGATIPRAFGIWPVKMRVPTPVVKPAMTDTGTNLVTTPRRVTPDANWSPPQARVMTGRASIPCCSTAPTTRRLIAAAGPVMASVVPPNIPPATPDTAAVTSPTSAGTPLATAIAKDKGTAMQPTVRPAEISVKRVSVLNIFFHSGISLGIPKSRIRGFFFFFLPMDFIVLSGSMTVASTFSLESDFFSSATVDWNIKPGLLAAKAGAAVSFQFR